jgi:hypothetical protein
MINEIRDDVSTQSLVSLMFIVGVLPECTEHWLIFLSVFVYLTMSFKTYVTTEATGHHKFGDGNAYVCRKTKQVMALNEDEWNASGIEHHSGPVGCGVMTFTNSYRVPGWCKYVSLKISIPHFFAVGIDAGLVRGYRAYHDEGQMKSGIPVGRSYLFFMAPTIRWSAAHERNNFISIRQFGSATVTTQGRIER